MQRSQYSTVATTVVINVVLGGALWASAAITRKNLMNGAIVAGVISIILIYFGGQPGPIGGIVGIRSEEHTAELPSLAYLRCRLLLDKKKTPRNSTNGALPLFASPLCFPDL